MVRAPGSSRIGALVVALGLGMGACQGIEQPHKVVGAEESAIRFQHPDFEGNPGSYTVQREPRSGNELHTASFLGTDAVAVLAIYKTSASYVVKERAVESYVARFMGDEDLDWGASGQAASRLGLVPYRLFDVADQGLSCVGFSHTVGVADDRGRNSDLVVGYFCHDESRPMSAESAEDLIGQVSYARQS